jgi:FMN phosphatase YigB (HAD superfamily)
MFDTVLFDLDGTLLPLDMERFIKIYFAEMGRKFSDLIDGRQLMDHIWTATGAMVANLEPRTNATVFMEKFGRLIQGDLAVYQERFDQFYDEGFLKVKEAVVENNHIKESAGILKRKGYQLVIATNPLFPRKAIEHRIRWAGFEPEDFSYITCYEHNHYCKPQLQFYEEVLREIGKGPGDCLMVGNDVQEDMIAAGLGIETYLITDYLIHRTKEPVNSTYSGTYQDFKAFVTGLGGK